MEQTGKEALLALAGGFRPASVKIGMESAEQHPDWLLLAKIPLRLTAGIAVPRFTIRDLLALRKDAVVSTSWASTEDIPLRIGTVEFSWCEFEVVEQRMSVRLTRLG
jgi:flagellar motor switch protein FliN/FliY